MVQSTGEEKASLTPTLRKGFPKSSLPSFASEDPQEKWHLHRMALQGSKGKTEEHEARMAISTRALEPNHIANHEGRAASSLPEDAEHRAIR